MSINLMDLFKDQVSGAVMSKISGAIGESEENTGSALTGIAGTLIGSIASKSESDGQGIMDMISGSDSGIMSNIGDMLGGDKEEGLLSSGSGIISSLLGDKVGGIVSAISGASGVSESGTSKLMNIAGPLVTGFLGKHVADNGLDLGGLTGLLGGQKGLLDKFIPSGISDMLSFSGASDAVSGVADGAMDAASGAADAGASVVDKAKDVAGNVAESVSDAAGNVMDKAKDVAGDVADAASGVADKAKDMAGNAADAAGAAVDKAKDVAGNVAESVSDAAGAAVDKTKEVAGAAVDKTKEVAGAAADKTKEAAGAAIDKTKEVAGAAADKAKDAAGAVSDKAKDMAGNVSDAAGAAVDKSKEMAGEAADAVKSSGKKIIPILILVAVVLLVMWLLMGCGSDGGHDHGHDHDGGTEQVDTETPGTEVVEEVVEEVEEVVENATDDIEAMDPLGFDQGSWAWTVNDFLMNGNGSKVFQLDEIPFEGDEISAEGKAQLDNLAAILKASPDMTAEIQGHTSKAKNAVGAASKKTASAARAAWVKAKLTFRGVDGKQLSTKGYGDEQLLADIDPEDDAQKRISIMFMK